MQQHVANKEAATMGIDDLSIRRQLTSPSADVRQVSRRRFLRMGVSGLGAMTVAGLLSSCDAAEENGSAPGGAAQAPSAGSTGGTPSGAVTLRHDAGLGPIIEPYVADFNRQYPEIKLSADFVPQDYFGVTRTQLAAGDAGFDVMFSNPSDSAQWHEAGWIMTLDDFPGVSEIMGALLPGTEESLRDAEGSLIALPYFVGTELFTYNAEHLSAINEDPPGTWEEFLEQCRRLKADGVVDTPLAPFWTQDFDMTWYPFVAEVLSIGGTVFDGERPVLGDDPAVRTTLERWQTLFNESLVPQDIFTTAYGDIANIYGGGRATFSLRYGAQVKGWADPEQSEVAEASTLALIPGTARDTYRWNGSWNMTSSSQNPDAAWTLMRYLAYKDRDGQFYVPTNLISKDLALLTPYEEVNTSEEVVESISEYADADIMNEQLNKSQALGAVENRPWFSTFRTEMSSQLQDIIRGAVSIKDGIAAAVETIPTS
jgi:multiple sugar transport system substrate-binding protein